MEKNKNWRDEIMSICPKYRVSKARGRKRRFASWISKVKLPKLVKCKKCGAYALAHKVCRACGNYNGRLIIEKKLKNVE